MKKSAGRKERRRLERVNRRAEGRKRAKQNEIKQKTMAKKARNEEEVKDWFIK